MKVIVAPLGSFMYVTNEPGISIVPERPTLVKSDEFIRALVMQRKIEQLGLDSVPDEATDAEWKSWFQDAGGWDKVVVAVESFLDKWGGLDEESLAEQARQTNARLEQERREKAEAEALAAQQQLLAEIEAKAKAEAETAKALAEAEKLAEEKRLAEVKAAEEKALAEAEKLAEEKRLAEVKAAEEKALAEAEKKAKAEADEKAKAEKKEGK